MLESRVLALPYLLDSGSGLDLITRALMSDYRQSVRRLCKVLNFDTANGRSKATEEAVMCISEMGDAPSRPILMENTPPVLSMGRRVVDEWFGHCWSPGEKQTVCVHPGESAVTLPRADRYLPTVDNDTPHWRLDSAEALQELEEQTNARLCTCCDKPALVLPIVQNNPHLEELAERYSSRIVSANVVADNRSED